MSKNLLQLHNVSVSFDKKKTYILKDICFWVNKGEILSIIGMNGTGKSTLLKTIAGIEPLASWSIEKSFSKLSYVPQKIQIDKTFPICVYEFIKIYNPKVTENQIKTYLEQFQAEHLYDKNIVVLSGGEFQKMLIISALLSQPELLLLDEPTAGIDKVGEEIFYKIISDVKQIFPDLAIILVSHNLHLVYKNSDNVVCLHKGNFCCHGTPQDLKENRDVWDIFGEYVRPYEHTPHKKHCNHNHSSC